MFLISDHASVMDTISTRKAQSMLTEYVSHSFGVLLLQTQPQ